MHLRPFLVMLLAAAMVSTMVACGSGDDDDDDDATAPTETVEIPDLNSDEGGSGTDALRQPVHWHADFAVVIDGEAFDFSDEKFVSGVDIHDHKDEYLHIHPNRFTVAHVHREGSTWREFFSTFGWTLSQNYFDLGEDGGRLENDGTNTWKFFVNGVRVDQVWQLEISDLQRVLIVYGPETPEEALEKYWPEVTDQACIVSGNCADRVDPNEPPEMCSGGGTCS